MKTILNANRLNRLTARIPARWADDLGLATVPCADAGKARAAESVLRNFVLWPALSELAGWRQMRGSHS